MRGSSLLVRANWLGMYRSMGQSYGCLQKKGFRLAPWVARRAPGWLAVANHWSRHGDSFVPVIWSCEKTGSDRKSLRENTFAVFAAISAWCKP